MATTIYNFQADLTQLLKLNAELERANITLKQLKANTAAYAAQSKKIGTISGAMKTNATSMKRANVQARALNRQGNRMVAIFRSASIAIVSAFAFRAIIGGLRGVITSFSDFEQQMAAVRAISGATDREFKKLNDSALELGRTTVFTARQVGELQEEYARLGFTADEIVAAQQGTIALAAATGESLKSSAETSGAVIRAFGLDARDTTRVVDIMGASFTSSALNLERFRESMKFVAPVARAAGFTLEETSAMLAQLADNGLHGSIAGNALKNIMLRLGDSNSKLNKSLGKTVQGLPQFIEALKGMKDESFGLTEAVELLDKRSAPAFLALISNIGGLEGQLDTLNEAEGAVSRMSQIRLDTLEGDFTLLQSATEGLGVAIGDVFENSLRKSIDALTQWVQGLAGSEKFLTGLNTAFSIATNVVNALIIRFALLKLSNISLIGNFKKMTQGIRLLVVSMRNLALGTGSASTALKGFRAALASTGVGLLVVGIGALVGWLTRTKEETSEVVHQMDRLHRSFAEDITQIATMNVENSERVDLLRKLNQDYPELIGNIDLEVASNQQLLDILSLVNDTRAERSLVEDKQAEIDKIWEVQAQEEMAYLRTIAQEAAERKLLEAKLERQGKLSLADAKRADAIDKNRIRIEKNIRIIKKNAKIEENILLKDIKIYQDMIKKKQKANGTWNELTSEELDKYRMKQRNSYLEDLEDFRAVGTLKEKERKKMTKEAIASFMSQAKEKQEALIAEATAEKDFYVKVQKFHDLRNDLNKGSGKEQKRAAKEYNDFLKTLEKGEKKTLENQSLALNKVGIKIQEMRTFLVNLNAALLKSGPSIDKSAISVHKLNVTKDRIKELLKIQIDAIVDIDRREKAVIESNFEAKTVKYNKERKLISANLLSIATYINGVAKNQDDLNSDFITKNKSKYDVLKNLDAAGWDKLMESSAKGIAARREMLNTMYFEEVDRKQTNTEIIIALEDEKQRLLDVQQNESDQRLNDANKSQLKTRLSQLDTGFEQIFRSNKEFTEKLVEQSTEDLRLNEERVTLGEISAAEGAANKLKIEKQLSDDLNALEDQRLEKVKETYQAISQVIMDISANRAAVESQRVEDQFAKDTQIEQDKFDRQLQIAEKAGRDTEGMQKKHDIKMRGLENQKQEDLKEIKRKQFVLQKANDITMAIINGALAITKVTAQTGIGAIAAAPLTSALIGAQIAAIASRQFVGERGGVTPTRTSEGSLSKFAEGGMVQGPSHAQGGVKFASGGRVVELEGGEAVINKRSTKLFKPMLSKMNSHNGFGKKFAQGGLTPGTNAIMDQANDNWTARDIASLISGSINSQQVFVTEADISTSQSVVDIIEGQSTIF